MAYNIMNAFGTPDEEPSIGSEESRAQELLRILTEPEPVMEAPQEPSRGVQTGQTIIAALADALGGIGEAKGGRPPRRSFLGELTDEREQRQILRSQIEAARRRSEVAGRQRGAAYELGQLEKRQERRGRLAEKTAEQKAEAVRQERNQVVLEAREYPIALFQPDGSPRNTADIAADLRQAKADEASRKQAQEAAVEARQQKGLALEERRTAVSERAERRVLAEKPDRPEEKAQREGRTALKTMIADERKGLVSKLAEIKDLDREYAELRQLVIEKADIAGLDEDSTKDAIRFFEQTVGEVLRAEQARRASTPPPAPRQPSVFERPVMRRQP